MSAFLTVNENDSEDLKKIKQIASTAINTGDIETISYMKLRATSALVGSLVADLKFPEDDDKTVVLDDFLRNAIQHYRDTVVLVNITELNESVYKDDSGEIIKGLLKFGASLARSKIISNEILQKDIADRMVKSFPSLTDSIEKNDK